MEIQSENRSFFVKVDGVAFSNHRNPQGVYRVEVIDEQSLMHSAHVAIQTAKDYVPFLDENIDSFTIRAFLEDGQEVFVPRSLNTVHDEDALYCGRALTPPECITLQ